MRLLFATQEVGKLPSGVVTVVTEICRSWPGEDGITVLTNRGHWAWEHFQTALAEKENIRLRRLPVWQCWEWAGVRLPRGFPRPCRYLLRIGLLPLSIPIFLFVLVWSVAYMRREGIDGVAVHAGGWPPGALEYTVVLAARLARVPKRCLVIHNTPILPPAFLRPLYRRHNRLVGRMVGCVVTVSHACRKSLEEGADFGRRLQVVYNGIPERGAGRTGVSKRGLPWKKRAPTLGFVGELHPRKGVHVLLDALSRISTHCEIVLIGNGEAEYVAHLEKVAGCMSHPVHFLGFRNDVADLYPHIDVLVQPSLAYESFGMTIVEAMRASVPVICSDFGGMKEVVADGETGFVVPAGDADALAKAIERLLRDETLRRRMGEAGRLRLHRRFTSEIMVRRYVDLFHTA